jgi:hypothetical protein
MNKVWLLELDLPGWGGIVRVYASLSAAVDGLEEFLEAQGIDSDAARWGETVTATSVCNDPDPDLLDGLEVSYGINEVSVWS